MLPPWCRRHLDSFSQKAVDPMLGRFPARIGQGSLGEYPELSAGHPRKSRPEVSLSCRRLVAPFPLCEGLAAVVSPLFRRGGLYECEGRRGPRVHAMVVTEWPNGAQEGARPWGGGRERGRTVGACTCRGM